MQESGARGLYAHNLVIAAAIGVVVMLVWQRPSMQEGSDCFTSGYPQYHCGKMFLANILHAICWIVLGASLGAAVIYVTRLSNASGPPQAPGL